MDPLLTCRRVREFNRQFADRVNAELMGLPAPSLLRNGRSDAPHGIDQASVLSEIYSARNVYSSMQAQLQRLSEVKAKLKKLVQDASAFREQHPNVKGASKFCSRIGKGTYRVQTYIIHYILTAIVTLASVYDLIFDYCFSELTFAGTLEEQLLSGALTANLQVHGLANKVQGLKNNYRGLAAELEVATTVPGVVGLSQQFPLSNKGEAQINGHVRCQPLRFSVFLQINERDNLHCHSQKLHGLTNSACR